MPEKKKHPPPFSLRLTREERLQLDRQAAGMPVGAYIRERLFGPEAEPRRTRGRFPIKDYQSLAKLLALLGRHQLASSLSELARAAKSGSLPVTPETEEAILEGIRDVATIKRLLITALGIKEG